MYFMQKIVYPQSVLTKYGNKKESTGKTNTKKLNSPLLYLWENVINTEKSTANLFVTEAKPGNTCLELMYKEVYLDFFSFFGMAWNTIVL